MYTIAIDAMGGDHGPRVTVPAALKVLRAQPDVSVILVGNESVIQPILRRHKYHQFAHGRCDIVHASQQVEMDESPAIALRTKKDSAMRVAINLVKEGRAQACVSAGNTGALMATARFVLKTIDGIDRPAIVVDMPTMTPGRSVRILDLGANVDCTAEQLLQFAIMGTTLVSAVTGRQNPPVALLNIGEEDIKGNETVKKAAELLSNTSQLNYAGYVEGDKIFSGDFDVIVCDGFVGNVMLKTSEGVVRFIKTLIERVSKKSWFHKLALLPAYFVLRKTLMSIDPRNLNGTIFLGLNGIVVKSHGKAKVHAFASAIDVAIKEVAKDVPSLISAHVAQTIEDLA